MEYEDFYNALANDFGVNGLASGNYDVQDTRHIFNAILAMSHMDQLGYLELESAAKIALMVNDDEDRRNLYAAIQDIQKEIILKGK